jgi:hypothetical protein
MWMVIVNNQVPRNCILNTPNLVLTISVFESTDYIKL